MALPCYQFAVIIIVIFHETIGQTQLGGLTMSDEKRLIKHMLENYEKVGTVGRPVYNTSETVRVSFGLALIQLSEVNVIEGTITILAWQRYLWNDILLKWNPEDFGGIAQVRVPINQIWEPDIVLYNNAEEQAPLGRSALAVVSYDGTVMWIPPAKMKASCSFNMLNFPFDTQVCTFKFGSWTYDGFKLDIDFYDNLEEVDITDYIVSNEWELIRHPARKNVKYYPCCAEPYPDLTFSLHFRRISMFYHITILVPFGILTALLLAIYWLPTGSNSKFTLGGVVLFAKFLLLLHVAIMYKASSLVAACGLGMIFAAVAMMLSVLTANIARIGQNGCQMPRCLYQVFVRMLGCLCCVCRPSDGIKNPDSKGENTNLASREWEAFATVLDRLFFAAHLLVVLIAFAIVTPH